VTVATVGKKDAAFEGGTGIVGVDQRCDGIVCAVDVENGCLGLYAEVAPIAFFGGL
jgi:hypothetical protein